MSTPDDARRRTTPDRSLVAAMREPGSDALVVLLRRHAAAVHDYVAQLEPDPDAAEDIFLRVFVRAWSHLTVRRMPGDSALPWMLAAANEIAAASGRVPRSEHAQSADDGLLHGATGVLAAAIERLDPRERRIVELCLRDGCRYDRAVRATGSRGSTGRRILFLTRSVFRGTVATSRGSANG